MGTQCQSIEREGSTFQFAYKPLVKMTDTVETTTTPAPEEVKVTEEAPAEVAEEVATNGAAKENTSEVTTTEATKRKAEEASEEETSEKVAKLKEVAAEKVVEAEKELPEEPLTEA